MTALLKRICYVLLLVYCACNNKTGNETATSTDTNAEFDVFKPRFLDAYWKEEPSNSIAYGYGKYYDSLKISDSAAFAGDTRFYKAYLDSLRQFNYNELSDNNKISYKIIGNQLSSNIWYTDTLRLQEWDPSYYNIGNECYELIDRPFAPLTERLQLLSKYLRHTDAYFNAALTVIKQPTREHTELAIRQNTGSMDVLGASLVDSVNASGLSAPEKDTLLARIAATRTAITGYVTALHRMLNNKAYVFRDFRIGEQLFNRKFYYDIVTRYTPKEIFDKAIATKKSFHQEMYGLANGLWKKYCGNESKPSDSLLLIKKVIDKISLHHVAPALVFDTLNKHLYDLKRFIIQKDLFDFDTTAPLKVRRMPAYASGVSLASADFPLPYQRESVAYYNIADLTAMSPADAESQLRENNDYILQILSIHEAMPGHCLQGIYNSRKSFDIIPAVFNNGAMIEGWAIYTQRMMLDNGWNNSPEMWLMFYKWSLRECCNVIIDYGIQCLNYSKKTVTDLLINEAFQEKAQVEEKWHRATVSQVQLCSYFTGNTEINALREDYRKKEGDQYSLKKFHEKFLSYGSAPVGYIREMMKL